MPSVRKVKTPNGGVAIQVVRYKERKVVVMKHIGSTHVPEEISALVARAEAWIARETPQRRLFEKPSPRMLDLAHARYCGVRYAFAYDTLVAIMARMGWKTLQSPLLLDLALMRIIEPSSKLRAIALLKRYFGVEYAERTVYRTLPMLKERKAEAEKIAIAFAKDDLSSDLSLVLYDVTTLYFETFDADGLRVPGFSKDNKSQQPQIVAGLLVTREGFPLGYEVFKGNTFEGHTMLPVLDAFAKAHHVAIPTVVADAAMISRENVAKLKTRGLSYIVGARMANAPPDVIEKVSATLAQKDGAMMRLATDHGNLVCDFSAKRYRKDAYEMEKQVAKAKELVEKGEPGKRAKFVARKEGEDAYVLHDALIEKTKRLLGIKGYYTNIPEKKLANKEVVARYHDLWNVEASFRMAKNDLMTRPIFHHKEDAVRAHMVVCFVALTVGRYLERATNLSMRGVRDILWSVTDAQIFDAVTKETIVLRSELDENAQSILKKLSLSH